MSSRSFDDDIGLGAFVRHPRIPRAPRSRQNRLLTGARRPRAEPPARFVMLAMQRSGSNMLMSSLNSHPAIYCYGELFRRSADPTARLRRIATFDPRFHDETYRQRHPEEYLEEIYGMGYDVEFVGFKLLSQQHPQIRNRLIDDPRYAKILLRRDNVLARYSSDRLTKGTRSGKVEKGGKVAFVEAEFRAYRRNHEAFYEDASRRLLATGRPFLEISYLEACTPAGLQRIVAAIGADTAVRLRVGTTKRNSSDIVSRFSNPADVEAWLAANRLEHWRTEQFG